MSDTKNCDFSKHFCDERHTEVNRRLANIEHTLHDNGLVSGVAAINEKVKDLPDLRKFMYKLMGALAAAQAVVSYLLR